MSWSSKRKSSIIVTFFGIVAVIVAIIAYRVLSVPATCSDRTQNQGEVGIDCGGPCSLLCTSQIQEPIISWKRIFPVADGAYNFVAYIENPNTNAGAEHVGYRIRVSNAEDMTIYERYGNTVIPARRSLPIVETGMSLGGEKPSQVEFKLDKNIVWKTENEKATPLLVSNILLKDASSTPRLTAIVDNKNENSYQNVEVVALLYDEKGNAIGASRTFVNVGAGGSVPVIFTWPQAFSVAPARIEVIPKLFI